eukprot:scaffold149861_cov29-Tisochrysis_lutea.AAC.1
MRAELSLIVDPVLNVWAIERLRPDLRRGYAVIAVLLDHLVADGVVRGHARALRVGLELRSEPATLGVDESNRFRVGHHGGARCVQVRAVVGGAAHVFADSGRRGNVRVHLSAERLELRQGDVGCAARGFRVGPRNGIGRHKGLCALRGQWRVEDIGRRMQVTL